MTDHWYLQGMNFGFHDFTSEILSSVSKAQMRCLLSPKREHDIVGKN